MTGLCLSGGGAKGAFEVGVLEYIAEHPELFPDGFAHGAGCSVGAVNLGGLVQFAPGPTQIPSFVGYMVKCWEELGSTQAVWKLRFPPYIAGFWSPSIGETDPLRGLLTKLIDVDKANVGTPCEVAAWDLLSGRPVTFALHKATSIEELVSFIMASSSFPLAFPPEPIGELYCTDGGISEIAPVGRLIKAGCDRVLTVLCRNPEHPEPVARGSLRSVYDVGVRCLDGMESELSRGDLEQVRLWNLLVEAKHPAAASKRVIVSDVIMPDEPLGDPLDFSQALTQRRRKVGYESARKYFLKSGR